MLNSITWTAPLFRRSYHGFALLLVFLLPAIAQGAEKVRLQLKWRHQFQFAGYYAAQEKGYYREAGLEVKIIPAEPGEDAVRKVLDGEAEFGVSSTDLLLWRERGEPVVALAVIFQHSPVGLVTLKRDSGLQSIHDLAGRKVMIESGSSELFAYLNKEGIPQGKFTLAPHSFQIHDLLDGKVEAMSTYVTDEPFALQEAGKEYLLYSPRSVGIDFYGDNLFTTQALMDRKPDLVKAFRRASLKGWEYAMKNPEEVVQLIYARYDQRHSLEHLRFEAAQMKPLLQAALVELGHINPGRWQHIAETYNELGMMKADRVPDGFLYDPNPPPDLTWLYRLLGLAVLVIAGVALLAAYIYRINTKLRREVADRIQAEQALKESETALQDKVVELRQALEQIKTLRGILPICMSCKKIRDDQGYWNQLEVYIHQHTEADFSHGLCPDCMKKIYPDFG